MYQLYSLSYNKIQYRYIQRIKKKTLRSVKSVFDSRETRLSSAQMAGPGLRPEKGGRKGKSYRGRREKERERKKEKKGLEADERRALHESISIFTLLHFEF